MILFRQLEVLSSRDQVLAAIASVLGHPHALSVDDLVTALAQHTGLDLSGYAAAWIHGSGTPLWPRFALTFTQSPGTSALLVHQVTALDKRCKFHIDLRGANPGESTVVEVDTFHNGTDQTLQIATPAYTVTAQYMDVFHECLVFKDSSTPRDPSRQPWVAEQWRAQLR
jgi:hypothetical protein